MNLYEKPKKESFVLDEVKSKDRASLDVKAHAPRTDGAANFEMPYNGSVPVVPHPDLFDLFDKLKVRLASAFGYLHSRTVVNDSRFGANAMQKELITEATDYILADIKVTGISLSGKERTGLIVKGTYKGQAINTKPLHFSNQEYGEEIQEIADNIRSEVYEFLFKGKKAQLNAFDEEEEDEEQSGKDKAAGE